MNRTSRAVPSLAIAGLGVLVYAGTSLADTTGIVSNPVTIDDAWHDAFPLLVAGLIAGIFSVILKFGGFIAWRKPQLEQQAADNELDKANTAKANVDASAAQAGIFKTIFDAQDQLYSRKLAEFDELRDKIEVLEQKSDRMEEKLEEQQLEIEGYKERIGRLEAGMRKTLDHLPPELSVEIEELLSPDRRTVRRRAADQK